MPIVAGDIIRVAARMKLGGVHDILNVLHFRAEVVSEDGDMFTLLDLAQKLSTAYAFIKGHFSTVQTTDVLDVYNVSDDAPLGAIPWNSDFTGGDSSGDYTALGVSCLCLLGTATKRVQGRIYVGALTEASITNGQINAATVPDMQNFMAELRDDGPLPEASVFVYGVYSRASNILRPVTSQRVVLEPAYQTRRKRGRGS